MQTVQELRAAKDKLEEDIYDLLRSFEQTWGCEIKQVNIVSTRNVISIKQIADVSVDVEVF